MKYKLRFNVNISYEVDANSEEEALAKEIPVLGRRVSIEIIGAPCSNCGKEASMKQGKDWVCKDHMGFGKVYKCTVCGINNVDAENGFDTCEECVAKH